MRIHQLQNLCWAGNVVVFVGMGLVGHQFYGSFRSEGDKPDIEWPEKAVAPPVAKWPPGADQFTHVWKTWVNGEVPPPPKPPEKIDVKPDVKALFRRDFEHLAGFEYLTNPARSSIRCLYPKGEKKEVTVKQGEMLGDWRFIAFHKVKGDGDKVRDKDVLVFWHPGEDQIVRMEYKVTEDKLVRGLLAEPTAYPGDPVTSEIVTEDKIPAQAHRDPITKDWIVPVDEVTWWSYFGKKALDAAKLQSVTLPDGTPGLQFGAALGTATALVGSRGIKAADVLLSVNGVPMGSAEALLAYFQGPGKDATRLDVVIKRGEELVSDFYLLDRSFRAPPK